LSFAAQLSRGKFSSHFLLLHSLRKEVEKLDRLPDTGVLGVLAKGHSLEIPEVGSLDARRPEGEAVVHAGVKINELLEVTEVDLVAGVDVR